MSAGCRESSSRCSSTTCCLCTSDSTRSWRGPSCLWTSPSTSRCLSSSSMIWWSVSCTLSCGLGSSTSDMRDSPTRLRQCRSGATRGSRQCPLEIRDSTGYSRTLKRKKTQRAVGPLRLRRSGASAARGWLLGWSSRRVPRHELNSTGALGPDTVEADLDRHILSLDGDIEVTQPRDDGQAAIGAYFHVAALHHAVLHRARLLRLDVAGLAVDQGTGMDVDQIVADHLCQRRK